MEDGGVFRIQRIRAPPLRQRGRRFPAALHMGDAGFLIPGPDQLPEGVRLRPHAVEPVFQDIAIDFLRQEARAFAMREAYSIRKEPQPLQYLRWIPRYQELFREMQHTRELLHCMNVPCTAFQSAKDELVSLRSLPLLKANPAIRLHVLRESSHFYYPAADEARILRAWRRILNIKREDQGI